MNNIWRQIATNWRTFENNSDSVSLIEELTNDALNMVLEEDSFKSALEYLDEEENDDDDDLP
ncbi:hypothetical protein CN520_00535 [Bacillus cereus]|uniref:Uncharacterized protein n=1 Tax=Bacillus thuringiensis serovar mexicanensis TaxID=180868 RepID=A0A242W6Q5_BACTU|nr:MULTISPECIES: hypothetical protein [Bacillus cereus group]MEB9674114.1 hypothetical protein [Bacillus anthracis]OTW47529.1 hypothetical protein BK699_16975 [Bacillus thuringiensis serovar mexicanensis]OTX11794.1 hypothetical protein BK705_01300 [Bacillus thuringiensis serovar monterrey]PDZ39788.1 hypothetical protein CON18_13050 [Bacillus cereus]PET44028.1 hypothetical protein CN520_00535 [Bacillus cereus]